LSRKQIRARFEERFSAHAMARNYVATYTELVNATGAAAMQDAATGS
jgi:hypothetical protein